MFLELDADQPVQIAITYEHGTMVPSRPTLRSSITFCTPSRCVNRPAPGSVMLTI